MTPRTLKPIKIKNFKSKFIILIVFSLFWDTIYINFQYFTLMGTHLDKFRMNIFIKSFASYCVILHFYRFSKRCYEKKWNHNKRYSDWQASGKIPVDFPQWKSIILDDKNSNPLKILKIYCVYILRNWFLITVFHEHKKHQVKSRLRNF